MQAAVGCVTHGRFVGRLPHQPQLNRPYDLTINNGDPVSLRSDPKLAFSAGQKFRIVENDDRESGPFQATTIEYWYEFSVTNGPKLLTWHWTPETVEAGQRRYPHLHVESGIIDPHGPFVPDTLGKTHIPTGRVSIEAVVRFAIEELGAQPVRHDRDEVLAEGYASFVRMRRSSQ